MLIFLFCQGIDLFEFRHQDLISLLWDVMPASIPFSEPFLCYSYLSVMCATQWPIWGLGGGLSNSFISQVYGTLYWVRSMYVQLEGFQELYRVSFPSFPSLLYSWYFLISWGSSLQSSGRKTGAFFILLCCVYPTTASITEARWWKDGETKLSRVLPYAFRTTTP